MGNINRVFLVGGFFFFGEAAFQYVGFVVHEFNLRLMNILCYVFECFVLC